MTNGPCSIGCYCQAQNISQVCVDIPSFHTCILLQEGTWKSFSEEANRTDFRIHLVTCHCSLFFDPRAGGYAKWQRLADKIHLDNTPVGSVPEAVKLLKFAARGYHCHAQDTSQISFHLLSLFYILLQSETGRRGRRGLHG